MIRVGRTLKMISEIRVQNTQTHHLPLVKDDSLEITLVVGAPIATLLSEVFSLRLAQDGSQEEGEG